MTDKVTIRYDNEEVDLFDLLETLWAGRFVIMAFTVIPLLAGWALSARAPTTFTVDVSYSFQSGPLSAFVCETESCVREKVAAQIETLSNGNWKPTNAGTALSLATATPGPSSEYQSDLERINGVLRSQMLQEAETEAYLIESQLPSDSRQADSIANRLLQAKRIVFLLRGESTPLTFGPIAINESPRQSYLRRGVFTALLGGVLGSFLVLLQKAWRDRRFAANEIQQ